jgi:hypothetical protein
MELGTIREIVLIVAGVATTVKVVADLTVMHKDRNKKDEE